MNVAALITIQENRLAYLAELRASAVALGDTAQIADIDAQIAETQITLNKLQQIA